MEGSELRLRRNLGLLSAISYVLAIIGAGIFVSPQAVVLNVGRSVGVALCVWAFCACLAFCGALTYAEFGTRIPKSGSTYTYIKEAWGEAVAYLFLWSHLVLIRPMGTALGAMTAAEYILRPVFLDCTQLTPRSAKVLIALCIISILVLANCYDTRLGAAVQVASTVCKLCALFAIIFIGISFIAKGETDNLQDLFSFKEEPRVDKVISAVYACTYAYIGWDNLCMAVEEVEKPHRNIPLAILIGIVVVTACYMLANLAYHTVLTTDQIVASVAVAAGFCKMSVPSMMWLIVPCIGISAMGTVNAMIFSASRINFVGGRDSLFPEVLSMVSVSRRTPLVSYLVLGFIAGVVALVGDISSVLGAYALIRASGEMVAIFGIFRLRKKFPATPKTYVVPIAVPVTYLVVQITLLAISVTRDLSRYAVALPICLLGLPVYFLSATPVFKAGPFKVLNEVAVKLSRGLLLCDFASKNYEN